MKRRKAFKKMPTGVQHEPHHRFRYRLRRSLHVDGLTWYPGYEPGLDHILVTLLTCTQKSGYLHPCLHGQY